MHIPDEFNWVRDVFEPLIVQAHADRNMLELVGDDSSQAATVTYRQGIEKCNQLLMFMRRHEVQQGDSVFVMCGLNEGLWTTYLSLKGVLLIPAANILAQTMLFIVSKAAPRVIVSDQENVEKMEQALLQYSGPLK
jgi:acyl-coenzyme A synthetase/AMP-(fatty) acid ligase